jgi:SlyX protein
MSALPDETRLARLEERLAWFERHVTEQDKAMLELSELVDKLRHEVMRLRDRQAAGTGGGGPVDDASAHERPPHY